jgi:hypothetical protein
MAIMGLANYETRCDPSPWLNLIRRRSHSIGMGRGVTELNHHLPRAWLRWSRYSVHKTITELSVQDCSIATFKYSNSRSQWPLRPRRGSVARRLLGFWVWILPEAWVFASWRCCAQSGRGPCTGLITRPEELTECGASERDREVWILRRPRATRGCCAMEKIHTYTYWCFEGKQLIFSSPASIEDPSWNYWLTIY